MTCDIFIVLVAQDWGTEGGGLLGANIAFGYLHVLPEHCCETIGRYVYFMHLLH